MLWSLDDGEAQKSVLAVVVVIKKKILVALSLIHI